MARILVGAAALLSALALVSVLHVQQPGASRVELESAILPPRAFRKWVMSARDAAIKGEVDNDPPMDRLGGRGNHDDATKMPTTDEQEELERSKRRYAAVELEYGEEEEQLRDELRSKPHDKALLKKLAKIEEIVVPVRYAMYRAQERVNEMNKDLVQGRARKWNRDSFMGGSDHFVPLYQAREQLSGEGYGKRYSVTDWLAGK